MRKDGERWTLVLTRELRHPPQAVWQALTDPAELGEWSPFDADRNLAAVGPVRLHHGRNAGATGLEFPGDACRRAEAARYRWGGNEIRWQLEPLGDGTRLTLWHNIDRGFISMGAAGWHICLDVLERLLAGEPVGRIVGLEAMKFEWPRLNVEYARQFGVEAPAWPPKDSRA